MIRVYLSNDTWMADMQFAANAAQVRKLFGTDQLPTPFTARTDGPTVRQAIAIRNPTEQVNLYQP